MDYAGNSCISIDCREQGGNTGNNVQYTSGSMQSVVSKGLLDKSQYYYRAVYVDCIRAIDFAYEQCNIDKDKIIVEGASQGGALSMAVSALDDRPLLALADVPSNSNIDKRVESTTGAYKAVSQYLKLHPYETDKVLDTLSYFDTMNMADNIRCKVLASVGLMDNVCPAKYYFATYNRIPGEKDIVIYPFNGHEGGSGNHRELKMRFISDNLK